MADVLDAFALVALGRNEPAETEVEMILRRGDAVVTSVNLGEAVDVLARVHRHPAELLREQFGLLEGSLRIVDVDQELAWRAAELRGRHYHRTRSPLSLADCLVLGVAQAGDSVATSDQALAQAARAEDIGVTALPDRDGRRP